MRSLERGARRETLEKAIGRIAFAYGFSASPAVISKKSAGTIGGDTKTAAALALLKTAPVSTGPLQLWGTLKTTTGTALSLAVVGTKHAIGNALIVKTALSIVELSGLENAEVLVSSVGDAESKRRYTRELTNFFKKNQESLPSEVKARALHEPDAVYRELLKEKNPILEKAPKAIDYLSENSRKSMLETLAFFESVGLSYTIDSRLHGESGIHGELVFAIDATDKAGARIRVASGGRFDQEARKTHGILSETATGLTLLLSKALRLDEVEPDPQCFVIHVGDAAMLKAFVLLESLWRSHVSITQKFLSENFREQVEASKVSGAKYLAILGQREAIDKTVIVRNAQTQLQTTVPLDKLESYLARGMRTT